MIVINTEKIDPLPVMSGETRYPERLEEKIAEIIPKTAVLDATSIAEECGSPRAANIVLVGLVGRALGMPREFLAEAVQFLVPEKAIEINLKALTEGWNYLDNLPIKITRE